jgi:cell division protein FtsB
VVPVITALAGWVGGSRKKRNDFLSEMQKSIDLLTVENTKLVAKVVELNREIVALRKENEELSAEIEKLNKRLENIKTITKTAK